MTSLRQTVEQALNATITALHNLAGGDIADVSLLKLADGTQCVVKCPRPHQPDTTATEALMLRYLAAHSDLPVPSVLHQEVGILVLSHIPNSGIREPVKAAESIAFHVAKLHRKQHRQTHNYYGFDVDTVIGPLPQRNTPTDNWVDFFRDRRLLPMAECCLQAKRLDAKTMVQIEKLASKLPDLLPTNPLGSLLHGDLWAGNILVDGNRAAGFIDPAISYGHREMDLAFIELMGGLHQGFFAAYAEHYSIDPEFFEERCALYQLWPLLVHVCLFGGGYLQPVTKILKRFGG